MGKGKGTAYGWGWGASGGKLAGYPASEEIEAVSI